MDAVETGLGVPTWPPRPLRDIFENKIAQHYLMDSLRIPHPRSWVFWREAEAMEALAGLPYPLVAKLSRGIKSRGVALIRTRKEAEVHVRRMFAFGQGSLNYTRNWRAKALGKYSALAQAAFTGRFEGNLERNYVLFQEFVAGNTHDIKLCLQGNRVFGERRRNRPDDFRASGSGLWEPDHTAVPAAAVQLSFDVAETLGVGSLVLDLVMRGDLPLVIECSYTSAVSIATGSDGHWVRENGQLSHRPERVDWPAAVWDDFIDGLARQNGRDAALADPSADAALPGGRLAR
jgi:hypothetical protein